MRTVLSASVSALLVVLSALSAMPASSNETVRKQVPCSDIAIRIAIANDRSAPDKCEDIVLSREVETHVGFFRNYRHLSDQRHSVETREVKIWTRFVFTDELSTYFPIGSFSSDLAGFWKDFSDKASAPGAIVKVAANGRDYEHRVQTYRGLSCLAFRSFGHYRGLGSDSKAIGVACLNKGAFDEESAKALLARLKFGRVGAEPAVERFEPRAGS